MEDREKAYQDFFFFFLFWDRNGLRLYSDTKLSNFHSLLSTCKHSSLCLGRNTSSVTLISGHLCWATVKHTQEYNWGTERKWDWVLLGSLPERPKQRDPSVLLWLREGHNHMTRPKHCDSPSAEIGTALQNTGSSGQGCARLVVSKQEEEKLFWLFKIWSPIHCSVGITLKNVKFKEFHLLWAQQQNDLSPQLK